MEEAIVKIKDQLSVAKSLLKEHEKNRRVIEEPRFLTEDEINDIVDVIPKFHSAIEEIGELSRKAVQNHLKNMMKDNKLVPSAIGELKRRIVYYFERSRMAPGTPVGILAAQAISAQLMQATLNTFKSAGSSKNVSSGIKAYEELFHAKKEVTAPSCDIYFKEQLTFEDVIIKKRPELVELNVNDLITNLEMRQVNTVYDVTNPFNINHYRVYQAFNNHILGLQNYTIDQFVTYNQTYLRLTFDVNKIYRHDVSIQEIVEILNNANKPGIICIPSAIVYENQTKRQLVLENGFNVYKDVTKKIPVYYVDIYKYIEDVKKKMRGSLGAGSESISDDVAISWYYTTALIPSLDSIYIKGIKGISNIYPEKQSVWSIVRDEIKLDSDKWRLVLDEAKMKKTGITASFVRRLCEVVGITVDKQERYQLLVTTPPLPEDATKTLKNDKMLWKPGQVINYYKLKDLDDFNQYAEEKRKERTALINEGKSEEAALISIVRPTSKLENALDYIYAVSDGSNLFDLIRRDDIDATRTICNDMNEIIQMYGAEAARRYIFEQLYNIVNQNENYIDPRHTMLIADHMTLYGYITPTTIVGVRQHPVGTLTMAGYKVPKTAFHSAAITGVRESLDPSYASIITGKLIRFGTGLPTASLNSKYEQELYEQLKKENLYQLDSESLADTYARLEKAENDQLQDINSIEEQTFMKQDEMGNVIIGAPKTTSPFIPPSTTAKSTSSVLNLMPAPVISNANIELFDRIKQVPVLPRDKIENVTLRSSPPKEKTIPIVGVEEIEPPIREIRISYPTFTTGIESPEILAKLHNMIQTLRQ